MMGYVFVVTADDLGLNADVNRAIFQLFDKGLCSRASMISNMDAFDDAISLSYKHGVESKIGVHLNVTEGFPLTDEIKKCDIFCDKNGLFSFKKSNISFCFSKKTQHLVYDEFCAQIEKCTTAGMKVGFVDTHHHIHENPLLFYIIREVLNAKSISCLRKVQNIKPGKKIIKRYYRSFLNYSIEKRNLGCTDYFGDLKMVMESVATKNFTDSRFEVMVHPGRSDGESVYDVFDGRCLDEDIRYLKQYGVIS